MNLRFLNSLRLKLALGFLLVALVPLATVSFFSVRAANRLIEDMVTNQLENVAAEKQQLLERWIAERRADVGVVAASEVVKGMDPAAMAKYLKVVQDRYEVYRRFVVAGPRGRVVYDSSGVPPRDWRETPAYQRAMVGEQFMSDVHLDDAGGESVFDLAMPVPDGDGRPQGVVSATVSTAGILRWVLRASLGETGECYLVDKTGTFLVHKDSDRILRDNIAGSGSFANIFRQRKQRPVYMDYRGIAVLGASRAIPGTEWYVVVEQDEAEAFAPSYRLQHTLYLAIVLTAAGAVGVSLALAYYISSPIRVLSEAAHALARGEFESPLIAAPTARHDEIGMLHTAFANMAHQLQDRQASLETRMGRTEVELQQTDLRLQQTIQAAARSHHLAALGRLASGVAHEIRTPLASLKLYLQSVHDEITISPEFTEDFRIAMRQVERIEATINHFLNFARPAEPVMTDVDFRRLVDDALMVVRPRANHQDATIEVAIASELPSVPGDMRQLGEAMVNLLVNALDAMPKGGRVRIGIAAERGEAKGGPAAGVRIDVSDNGPGIRPDELEKLFEPFFTTKAAGSGLGLAIVRGTAQRHGGAVQVRSVPGDGAVFSILLPAAVQPIPG